MRKMHILNFGIWNSTNLHIFRMPNINLQETIFYLKLKIMGLLRIDELDKIDLIHCGNIMVNGNKISSYVTDSNSLCLIFVIKKDNIESKNYAVDDLNKMFEDYNDAYINCNLKKIIVNTLKPEIIKKLIIAIPELLKDKIAYSLIKDPFLFGTILKPCVLKNHIEKHPSLLLALDYILKKILKESDKNRIRPYVHLSDEDFSESDDIEIDYTDHVLGNTNVSYDPITITQLANAIQNANRNNLEMNEHEQEDIDMFQLPLFHDRVFENAMLNVLQNRNTIEQQQGPSNIGLTSQLRQMHELGLTDDLLNFRALGVAGGDMQEAVELILNGIID